MTLLISFVLLGALTAVLGVKDSFSMNVNFPLQDRFFQRMNSMQNMRVVEHETTTPRNIRVGLMATTDKSKSTIFTSGTFMTTMTRVLAPQNVVYAVGFPISRCLCGTRSTGPECEYLDKVVLDDQRMIYTLMTRLYTNATSCASTYIPQNYTFAEHTVDYAYACDNGQILTPAVVNNTVTTSATPYAGFIPGGVLISYGSNSACLANAWSKFQYSALSNCVLNPGCNSTVSPLSLDTVQSVQFSDSTCTKPVFKEININYESLTCRPKNDDDSDDNGGADDDFFGTSVDTITLIGISSSSSSSGDTVSLSNSNFGGLVAAVFIALLVGMCCMFSLFYAGICKVAGGNGGLAKNENNL